MHPTLNDLINTADMLITTNGDVVSWFDPSAADIKERKLTLYRNNQYCDRASITREVKRTKQDTYEMLMNNEVVEFRPYKMTRVDLDEISTN